MNPPGLFRVLCCVSGLSTGVALAAPPPDTGEAWEQLATLRFGEAAQAFDALEREGRADAEARLGRAVSLLARQPRTTGNVDEAERVLADLFTPEAATADPDLAARARLAHARIPHLHRQPVQWDEAEKRYRAAYEAAPGHEAGQAALVRAGLVTLFRVSSPGETRARAEAFARQAAALTHAEPAREAELLLSAVYWRSLEDAEAAYHHLTRALASPAPLREVSRADYLVEAAELALRIGRPAEAVAHYEAFLALARSDRRAFFVTEKLAVLRKEGGR